MTPATLAAPSGTEPAYLSLYVHIPFCVRKCHYCDFVAGPAPDAIRTEYVAALIDEIRGSRLRKVPVRTVFFGGGTPSELDTASLRRIVAALRESFQFVPASTAMPSEPPVLPGAAFSGGAGPVRSIPDEAEWTIECNPGTVGPDAVGAMREMGFNRISLGVQSFRDSHLIQLGRIHSASEAEAAVRMARNAGFRRLNLDLIFCLPGQSLAEWQEDVFRAVDLAPEHLSLYNLTIESQTEFGRRHRAGELTLADEDLSADMYEWSTAFLTSRGYGHYEVSNFCLPGEECRHNQVYWRREASFGFGVGAASYLAGTRWTVTRSMQRYLATAREAAGPERDVEECLDPAAACGEAMMLALRTREGADLQLLGRQHNLDVPGRYARVTAELAADGLLVHRGNRIALTPRGLMLANAVCGRFLE